jgi:hypothetical protein
MAAQRTTTEYWAKLFRDTLADMPGADFAGEVMGVRERLREGDFRSALELFHVAQALIEAGPEAQGGGEALILDEACALVRVVYRALRSGKRAERAFAEQFLRNKGLDPKQMPNPVAWDNVQTWAYLLSGRRAA